MAPQVDRVGTQNILRRKLFLAVVYYPNMSRSFLKASLTLVGTIIGAGVFALPAAFASVGVVPASFMFWLMALVVLATHLMMVDIELSTKREVRLAGAVKRFLGPHAFVFAGISYPCQLIGASVAYLVLGASFLATLVAPLGIHGAPFVFQTLFWVGGGVTLIGGLGFLARIESFATWLLIGTLLLASGWIGQQGGLMFAEPQWALSFGLFGVCLFSLGGIPGMGEVVEIAGRDRRTAQTATIVGTLIAAFVSWVFAVIFSGTSSIPDPMFLNTLLAAAGFLAVATSYIVTAQDLRATLSLDLQVHRQAALGLALGIPLVVTYIMAPSIYSIVGIVGTVFGGANGVLVALTAAHLYARHPHTRSRTYEGLCIVVGATYLAGIVYWLWQRVLY